MKLLDIKDLSILYKTVEGDIRAVDKVSLALDDREILGIVGESDAAKLR